jgi:hypothetical protein
MDKGSLWCRVYDYGRDGLSEETWNEVLNFIEEHTSKQLTKQDAISILETYFPVFNDNKDHYKSEIEAFNMAIEALTEKRGE